MICINFTQDYIYIIHGKASGKDITISDFIYSDLPCKITAEEIENVDMLSKSLRVMLENGKFYGKDTTVLFSSASVVANEYVLPYEKKPLKMQNIIKGQLPGGAAVLEESVMDYTIMDTFKNEKDVLQCRVCVYLVKKTLVEQAKALLEKANLTPYCFTVAQNCIYNLLKPVFADKKDAVIAANVSNGNMNVHLFNDANNIITRTNRFTVALNEDLYAKITSEATLQISRMIQFQTIKQPNNLVLEAYIFGDYATLQMAEDISNSLDIRVSLINAPDNVSAPDNFEFSKYVYPVGALLEGGK